MTLNSTDEMFDGLLDEGTESLGKIKEGFSSLFKEFLGLKNSKKLELELHDSIGDIMTKVGIDMLFNKNSSLRSMNMNDVKNLKYILSKKRMTETQAEELLIKKGLIEKICN